MNERWVVPILVAVVGLGGGLGGAYIGARAANKGQEKQFENQRRADVEDLAVAALSNFVRVAGRTAFLGRPATPAEQAEVFAAEAQVDFLFQDEPDVKNLATELERLATSSPAEAIHRDKQKDFVGAALLAMQS
jgi:hypothetical protein